MSLESILTSYQIIKTGYVNDVVFEQTNLLLLNRHPPSAPVPNFCFAPNEQKYIHNDKKSNQIESN